MNLNDKIKRPLWAIGFLALVGCMEDNNGTAPNHDSTHTGNDEGKFQSSYQPRTREYWITTEAISKWDMVPMGSAMMTNEKISPQRRYIHKAIRYVRTDAQWNPLPEPEWQKLSGPVIHAVVGDSVIVHFKNGANTGMPLSIHPHNVVYDEKNEGIWRADRPEDWPDLGTAGGAIKPGDDFTYRWKAMEKSLGAGPYHSHSFNPTHEIGLGLIGTIVVDNPPDHPDYVAFDTTVSLLFKTYLAMVNGLDTTPKPACEEPLIPWNGGCHPKSHVPPDLWPENQKTSGASDSIGTADSTHGDVADTARGGGPEVHTINGIAHANLPVLKFRQGQKVRIVVFAMNEEGSQNHTVHFHGEMLREMSNRKLFKDVFDLPSAYAQELYLNADNIGRWMVHCHVEHHASEMMLMYEIGDKDGNLPDEHKNNEGGH